VFPEASYYLLEDPDVISRFRADPQGFIDGLRGQVILDEIQNVPELFNYLRARIDHAPSVRGRWLLTGSQESALMKNATESMAGRAAVLTMLPLSLAETSKVSLFRGGFPEVLARPKTADIWFSSYLQNYLERDVRSISSVQDLPKFRRFMGLLATRQGQILNRTELAAPLGMSVPGVSHWLDILEATGLLVLVQPYFENLGKRLIKSPKVFFTDSGLVAHMLGIRSVSELERSPFLGALFEGAVAAEILKAQCNRGARKELYYFRDQQGLEVDFVMRSGGRWRLIEAKASHTPVPAMAAAMLRLADAMAQHSPGGRPDCIVVHRAPKRPLASTALAKGARALALELFVAEL